MNIGEKAGVDFTEARRLEDRGMSQQEIFAKTGSFKGRDGQWRKKLSTRDLEFAQGFYDLIRGYGNQDEFYAVDAVCRISSSSTSERPAIDISLSGRLGEHAVLRSVPLDELDKHLPADDTSLILSNIALGRRRFDVELAQGFYYIPPITGLCLPTAFMPHPLFKKYPEMWSSITLVDSATSSLGYATVVNERGVVGLSQKFVRRPVSELKELMVHEMQHIIQRIEGFARGGNEGVFKPRHVGMSNYVDTLKVVNELVSEVSKKDLENYYSLKLRILHGSSKRTRESAELLLDALLKENDNLRMVELVVDADCDFGSVESSFDQYYKIFGEVEAREVAEDMDKSQLVLDSEFPQMLVTGMNQIDGTEFTLLYNSADLVELRNESEEFYNINYLHNVSSASNVYFDSDNVSEFRVGDFSNSDDILVSIGSNLVNIYSSLYFSNKASDAVREDFESIVKWLGVDIDVYEKMRDSNMGAVLAARFGRVFADRLYDGNTPKSLDRVAKVLKSWFTNILNLMGLDAKGDPESNAEVDSIVDSLFEGGVENLGSDEFKREFSMALTVGGRVMPEQSICLSSVLDVGLSAIASKACMDRAVLDEMFPMKVRGREHLKRNL